MGVQKLCAMVCLTEEVPGNFSRRWVSPIRALQAWRSLTMPFTSKFLYIAHHFILLRHNPFGVRLGMMGLCFEYSV